MSDGEHSHEIFIIKRHGGHEEGHHGGVWKIAFADFMTAMMAFFLVMWLISANDKTKATIASYFNPVKLVDTTTQPKGLEDSKAVESSASSSKGAKPVESKETPSKEHPKAQAQEAAKSGGEEPTSAKAREKHLAAAMQDDPYAALTEIAGQKGAGEAAAAAMPAASSNKVSVSAISRKGGEAFRDPFSPPPPLQAPLASTEAADLDLQPAAPGGANPALREPHPIKHEGTGKDAGASTNVGATEKSEAGLKVEGASESQARALPPPASPAVGGADIKAQIAAAVKANGGDKGGPQVEVRKAEGGVLISLTDTADYEMFSTASAVPTRKVVLLMERIADVLKARPGKIVIRGFTDARPYKPGRYDNWHLSLDRAQTTHYMLVRGGFEEARVSHIEGYADRNLRLAANPGSPVNRRIEILLREDAP